MTQLLAIARLDISALRRSRWIWFCLATYAVLATVLVTASIQGTLTATPSLLALGYVPPAGVQGRYIVRGPKPFAITSIEGNGDGFTLAAADQTKKTLHVLTMTYRPEQGSTRGDLRRAFRVTTDLADEAPIELNASLHVNP